MKTLDLTRFTWIRSWLEFTDNRWVVPEELDFCTLGVLMIKALIIWLILIAVLGIFSAVLLCGLVVLPLTVYPEMYTLHEKVMQFGTSGAIIWGGSVVLVCLWGLGELIYKYNICDKVDSIKDKVTQKVNALHKSVCFKVKI